MEPSLEELEILDRYFSYACRDCEYGTWCQDCPICWALTDTRGFLDAYED
jgi:hypothetical protein